MAGKKLSKEQLLMVFPFAGSIAEHCKDAKVAGRYVGRAWKGRATAQERKDAEWAMARATARVLLPYPMAIRDAIHWLRGR